MCELAAGAHTLDLVVSPGGWSPVDFDDPFRKVHQPVLVDACRCVERRLDPTVLQQRGVGDFDDQQRTVRMRSAVIRRRNDRDVRFRLGVIRERQGALNACADLGRKLADQSFGESLYDVGVEGTLGAHVDQGSKQQLDSIVRQQARLDKRVVLDAPERANAIRPNFPLREHSWNVPRPTELPNRGFSLRAYARANADWRPGRSPWASTPVT